MELMNGKNFKFKNGIERRKLSGNKHKIRKFTVNRKNFAIEKDFLVGKMHIKLQYEIK